MDIITVNVGQGALAIVRHENDAIIVDAQIWWVGPNQAIEMTIDNWKERTCFEA
jgi:hypothetical protein